MHRPEYIEIIEKVASMLRIKVEHFSDNWAIKLSKDDKVEYIVGNTFSLNNGICHKIVGNKNLCSEILTRDKIPNVPHELVLSPSILLKRQNKNGNSEIFKKFIEKHGFPFLIKKNNSSQGIGVYMVKNEAHLEALLASIYTIENTITISPYRENSQEYRVIVLKGKCLLTFEKKIPFVVGTGNKTLFELVYEFVRNNNFSTKFYDIVHPNLVKKFNSIPEEKEKILLKWKHNSTAGIEYEIIENKEIENLAIKASNSVQAKFVSVDVLQTKTNGKEILEINSSVVLNSFLKSSKLHYEKAISIYKSALNELFI